MKTFKGKHFLIAYETWGKPSGIALLFFHGFPASRLQGEAVAPFVGDLNLFAVAADRPGYGGTTGKGTGIQYLDDLSSLLKSLGIKKYSVMGVSGGSPWAHVMTSRFAEDVINLRIVCGLGPFNSETKKYFSSFQNKALTLRSVLPSIMAEKLVNQALKGFNPEKGLQNYLKFLELPDQETLNDPANRNLILGSLGEARKQGGKGIVADSHLYRGDWVEKHCDLVRLGRVPTIYFHGQRDKILDYRMSEYMNQKNSNSDLTLFKDEGHYSLPIRHVAAVLKSLV